MALGSMSDLASMEPEDAAHGEEVYGIKLSVSGQPTSFFLLAMLFSMLFTAAEDSDSRRFTLAPEVDESCRDTKSETILHWNATDLTG